MIVFSVGAKRKKSESEPSGGVQRSKKVSAVVPVVTDDKAPRSKKVSAVVPVVTDDKVPRSKKVSAVVPVVTDDKAPEEGETKAQAMAPQSPRNAGRG